MTGQAVLSHAFSEPSELPTRLRTMQVQGVALLPHTFEAFVSSLDFGDFAVEIIRAAYDTLWNRLFLPMDPRRPHC
jgi:hypothetical protein